MSAHDEALERWLEARHGEAVAFLAELVKVPSDTPPGDNAHPARRAAELLGAMGFEVERHEVQHKLDLQGHPLPITPGERVRLDRRSQIAHERSLT